MYEHAYGLVQSGKHDPLGKSDAEQTCKVAASLGNKKILAKIVCYAAPVDSLDVSEARRNP